MQCLLVKVVGVCLKRSLLCLRRVTPGLCAVMVDGGTDFAFSVGKPAFRQHLALVSGLHTHIFLLYLMHLRMGGVDNLMDRSGKWIVPQASVGAFLHFFKVKLRFAFSGCLVKNALGTENFLCGDSGLCRVQPVRRTVGTVNVLSKCGIGTPAKAPALRSCWNFPLIPRLPLCRSRRSMMHRRIIPCCAA